MKITIRRAVENDIEQLIYLYKELYEEANYQRFSEFDSDSVYNFIIKAIDSNDIELFVATKDSEVVGFTSFIIYPLYFNENILCAFGMSLWSKKEYSKYYVGQKLYKRAMKYAKDIGVSYVDFAVDVNNTGLIKFHKRYGAIQSEIMLRNRLN